jgi:maltose alpha-D-glucosyltransferase/alpha-amylase
MMRSFSYAARSVADRTIQLHPENAASLTAWAAAWEDAAGSAFLRGYQEVSLSRPTLVPQPAQEQTMLRALLLEKAMYELAYELNNRPAWISIPLSGVLGILNSGV